MQQISNKHSPTGGQEDRGAGWLAQICSKSQTSTHCLEERKTEEQGGELRYAANLKQALTNWRGGRQRSRVVSSDMQQISNKHSLPGGEEDRGAGW